MENFNLTAYLKPYYATTDNLLFSSSMDKDGNIKSVNYNNQMRSQFLNVPLYKVQPLYNALKLFDDISYAEENLINLKLKPGKFLF